MYDKTLKLTYFIQNKEQAAFTPLKLVRQNPCIMKTACNLIKLVLFNQISIKTNKSGQNRLAIDIFTIKIPFWCYLSNQRTEGTDGEQNTELMTNCIYSEVCCTGDGALASESRGPSFFICILPPLYRLSTYDIVISNIYLQNYTYK